MAKHRTPPSPRKAQEKAEKKAAKKARAKAEKPTMPTIDLDEFLKQPDVVMFCALRGRAIQAYAQMEQSLCFIFSLLSGTKPDVAGVIFFKITSSRARDAIMEQLMKKKHGDTYTDFWGSLMRIIDNVTQTRNHIVHWDVANLVGDETSFSGLGLIMPNIFDFRSETHTPIGIKDIGEFIAECDTISRLLSIFAVFLVPHVLKKWPQDQVPTWRDIFRQPVVYPLPDNHPLCMKKPKPESQPPSSQE
jgi:hypothetical protein